MNPRQTAEDIVSGWARSECAALFLDAPLQWQSRDRLVSAIEAAILRGMQSENRALREDMKKKPAKVGA